MIFIKKSYKSEEVDLIIDALENRMEREEKHLIRTDTIFEMWNHMRQIDDDDAESREIFEIGMRQVMQSRLYARGYFSVEVGYFVNLEQCQNLAYLELLIKNKDDVIKDKVNVRNKIKELKGLDGQMVLVPDENNEMFLTVSQTKEEVIKSLEADAV